MEGHRSDHASAWYRAAVEDRGRVRAGGSILLEQGRAGAEAAAAHHVREQGRLRGAVMRRTAWTRCVIASVLAATAASDATAQGTLGAQGFGYPPGQLSAFSRSLGGSTAEVDPFSPINPAALSLLRRGGLYLQSEQESRSVDAGGQSGSTRSYRFPLFEAAVPAGSRGVFAVSFSTMLDRTWGTEVNGTQVFDNDTVAYVERFRSEGALNDVRAAGSYAIRDDVVVGVGVHLFPGANRLKIERLFDDSLSFAPLRSEE